MLEINQNEKFDYNNLTEESVDRIKTMSKKNDADAKKRGNYLKYIVEIISEKNEINDVKCFYSKEYISKLEAIQQIDMANRKINLRGPFPLFQNALSDSKIARWELEKERAEKDKEKIEKIIQKSKKNGDKYINFIFSNVFKVDRLIAYKSSKDCFTEEFLEKVLKVLEKNKNEYKKKIVTLNVESGEKTEKQL